MRPRIRVSFSGGRTSALMVKHVVEFYGKTHDILITFANTGCEHEETLKFVDRCDRHFGWGVVWLESYFNLERGKGVKSRVVDFKTASRKGEPFEWYIKKNGLPNMMNPRCTDRLKEHCMDHYTHKVMGWDRGSYKTAIGIRADEIDRINPNHKKLGFIYPLADLGLTKDDVGRALKSWPFDLGLESDAYGNCTWCWKKSLRKLMTLAVDDESLFEFPLAMEEKYGTHKLGEGEEFKRVMFRGNMSASEIIKKANLGGFVKYSDPDYVQTGLFDDILDKSIGCSESCEIG